MAGCFLFPDPSDGWLAAADGGLDGFADAANRDVTGEDATGEDATGEDATGEDVASEGDGPLGFCEANPGLTFCADFDGADFTGGWTSSLAKGATLVAETARTVSPPRSAHFTAARAADAASPFAVFSEDVPAAGASAHLEFDLFVVGIAGGAAQVFQVSRGPELSVSFSFAGNGGATLTEEITLADGGTENHAHSFTPNLATGGWHHLVFDVSFEGTKTMSLHVDGATALGAALLTFGGDATGAGRLRVGIGFASPGNYDLLVDDVALRM
jgi:hypothetical protein